MTQEPGPQRPTHYEAPADQLGFEFSLVDSYHAAFPEQGFLIDEALNDVKRYAGFGIPKYKIVDPTPLGYEGDPYDAPQPPVDELGFLASGHHFFTSLMLQAPNQYTDEELNAMSEYEQRKIGATRYGHDIIGELPPETIALLDGVYSLIGAHIVRDDRAAGLSHGRVVRQGEYQGKPIYIEEAFNDRSEYWQGEKTFSATLLDENFGERAAEGMNELQTKEFIQQSGIDRFEAHHFIYHNSVNKHNYHDIAEVLRQGREIVDNAGESIVAESLADTVDGVFEELGVRVQGSNDTAKIDRDKLKKKMPDIELDKDDNLVVRKRKQRLKKSARNIGRKLLGKPQK